MPVVKTLRDWVQSIDADIERAEKRKTEALAEVGTHEQRLVKLRDERAEIVDAINTLEPLPF